MTAIIPTPRCAIRIRPATMSDLPFIDSLQKLHSKQVGWMPTQQLEGKIGAGQVIVAWASRPCSSGGEDMAGTAMLREEPVGYCIGHDQYFKRDDLGIIYQMNVVPGKQRGLIGATLVKAMFDRAAYGCKLFCCWCAQDIEANYFWESLGFIPLAFRAGSRDKGRVHIFWQRRIRAGDTTTPYWFPSQTSGGSIREDRLVLPIPPGVHWKDEMPRVLPQGLHREQLPVEQPKRLPGTRTKRGKPQPRESIYCIARSKLHFVAPKPAPKERARPEKRKASKNDPKLVAAARQLRDRYLEQFNCGLVLPAGKYEVSRALAAPAVGVVSAISVVPPPPLTIAA